MIDSTVVQYQVKRLLGMNRNRGNVQYFAFHTVNLYGSNRSERFEHLLRLFGLKFYISDIGE